MQMQFVTVVVAIGLVSYLLGALPFCLLLGQVCGTDIRNYGSGNTGATNLARVVNYPVGLCGLLLDFLKGFAPAFFGASVTALLLGELNKTTVVQLNVSFGFLAIIGHCFPIYLGFDGGKGVATSLGVFVALMPFVTAGAFLVWLGTALGSGWVSLASILSAAALPLIYLASRLLGSGSYFVFYGAELLIALLASVLVIVRHKSNIARLLKGEERKFMDSPETLEEK